MGYRTEGIAPAGLSAYYSFQKVGARYYDPTFGCFLTRDTDLSQHPYAYCDGDPVNFSDPSGHSMAVGLGAVGAVIGLFIGIAIVLMLGPEIAVGVTLYAAAIEALEADTLLTTLALTLSGIAAGAYGGTIGENLDKENEHRGEVPDRPKKGIGWQGDKETSVSTYQDYHNGKKQGSPYTGSPHYPVGPAPK